MTCIHWIHIVDSSALVDTRVSETERTADTNQMSEETDRDSKVKALGEMQIFMPKILGAKVGDQQRASHD